MKDFDDEDLEFDDDLPELDLSDLDLEDEDTEASDSKKYELKKYDESLDDSEDFAALIKAEAFKAIDTKDSKASVPSTAVLDEEESDAEYFDYNEEDFDEEEKEKKPSTGKLVAKILLGVFLMNCTMPVTLYLANEVLKQREGLAFGLLAAALIPGWWLAVYG